MTHDGTGLTESLKRLVSTLISIVSTRLELLANELQEERLHLTQLILYVLFAIFCLGMALLLFTVFIVVLFWDDHRLAVLGGLSALFLLAAILTATVLRYKSKHRSRLFSVSIAELAKDRETLGSDHE